MKIHYATLQDREETMKLVRGLYSRGSPKSVVEWEKQYSKLIENTLVVEERRKIIAYLMFLSEKNSLCICDLYVLPKYQRKGIAWDLLKKTEKIAGKKILLVGVRKKDYPSRKLYKKFGFKFKEKKKGARDSEVWEK